MPPKRDAESNHKTFAGEIVTYYVSADRCAVGFPLILPASRRSQGASILALRRSQPRNKKDDCVPVRLRIFVENLLDSEGFAFKWGLHRD
jgi:hypothetical protein